MKLTQSDRVHIGLGRTDNEPMTTLEFRRIRSSLDITQEGIAKLIGSSKRIIIRYENESRSDTAKVTPEHARELRKIMGMKIPRRNRYVNALCLTEK